MLIALRQATAMAAKRIHGRGNDRKVFVWVRFCNWRPNRLFSVELFSDGAALQLASLIGRDVFTSAHSFAAWATKPAFQLQPPGLQACLFVTSVYELLFMS